MNLNGQERKYTIPDFMLEIIAREADRLLIPPANMLVILLDEIIRLRGLKK